jgi:hypothetical protein
MFDRDKAIETLISDDIDSFNNGFEHGLAEILYSGFKGYENYTDEELMQELTERDISELFGECDDV